MLINYCTKTINVKVRCFENDKRFINLICSNYPDVKKVDQNTLLFDCGKVTLQGQEWGVFLLIQICDVYDFRTIPDDCGMTDGFIFCMIEKNDKKESWIMNRETFGRMSYYMRGLEYPILVCCLDKRHYTKEEIIKNLHLERMKRYEIVLIENRLDLPETSRQLFSILLNIKEE